MIVVMDASAGIEIALDRAKSNILTSYLAKANKVLTSDLYKAETANAIWKYVNSKIMAKEDSIQKYKYCEEIIDEFVDISENIEEAINESIRLTHSIYDLLYFTLARRHGAVLLTLDKKLGEIAKSNGLNVVS